MKKIKKYFWNVLIGIDQLANAVLLGDPDETISSRLGKWLLLSKSSWRYKIARPLCRVLHIADPNHCNTSIEEDEGKDAVNKIETNARV